jgi:hypothetical protein
MDEPNEFEIPEDLKIYETPELVDAIVDSATSAHGSKLPYSPSKTRADANPYNNAKYSKEWLVNKLKASIEGICAVLDKHPGVETFFYQESANIPSLNARMLRKFNEDLTKMWCDDVVPDDLPDGKPAGLPEAEPAGEPDEEPDEEPDAEPDAEPDGLPVGLPDGKSVGLPPLRHKLCQVSVAFKTTVLRVMITRMVHRKKAIRNLYPNRSYKDLAEYMAMTVDRSAGRLIKSFGGDPYSLESQEARNRTAALVARYLKYIIKNQYFVNTFDKYMAMTVEVFGKTGNKGAAVAITTLLSSAFKDDAHIVCVSHIRFGGSDVGDTTLLCAALYEMNTGDIPREAKASRFNTSATSSIDLLAAVASAQSTQPTRMSAVTSRLAKDADDEPAAKRTRLE